MEKNQIKNTSGLLHAKNELKRQFDSHQSIILILGENIFHCKSESSSNFYRERIDCHLYMQDDIQNAVHTILEDTKSLFLPHTNLVMNDADLFNPRKSLSDLMENVSKLKRRLVLSVTDNKLDQYLIKLFRQHFLHLSLLYRPESFIKLQG